MPDENHIFAVDCSLKLSAKPSETAIAEALVKAMRSGDWFVVLHGQKSMMTLRCVEEVLREANEHLDEIHANFRLMIASDPHPHFPRFLLHECVPMRMTVSLAQTTLLQETLHSSRSYFNMLTSDTGTSPRKHRVHISSAVEIVDIERAT